MSDIAIRTEGLGKRYRLGKSIDQRRMLREAISEGAGRVAGSLRRSGRASRAEAREFWALRDVSLEIERGDVVGIVGRNGAGKSTLLKVLSRITEPTTGFAHIRGNVGSLLEVGSGFHPELTGRENVYLNAAILGMRRAEIRQKFDQIVEFAEVERFLDTPIKRYSSGMYTRLAFAVAAHMDTSVLIVDEVLAVGDMAFQEKCLGKMRDASQSGRTVLFVSHNMSAIGSLCNRGVLMEHGSVALAGGTAEVIDAYFDRSSEASQTGRIPRDLPRLLSTGEAWLDQVAVHDRDGNPVKALFLDEAPRVQVTFEVVEEIREAVIEIDVMTTDGVIVTTSTTIDGGRRPVRVAPGVHTADLDLDVVLTPGRYSLVLGIHHYNGETVDWVERAADFAVLDVTRTGGGGFRWAPRGLVRPPASWSVRPGAPTPSTVSA